MAFWLSRAASLAQTQTADLCVSC